MAGEAFLFPAVKFGFERELENKYSLLFEGGVEYARISEVLPDLGPQNTGILNIKLMLGLIFSLEGS